MRARLPPGEVMDGAEASDSDSEIWGAVDFVLEQEELEAAALVSASSRNCKRRREDMNDQQRQGGEEQVISYLFSSFTYFRFINFDLGCIEIINLGCLLLL